MSWFKWFGFNADPFFDKALEATSDFDDLMVKTKVVSEDIDNWPSVGNTQPFRKLVIGERGVGKSTALRYATHIFQKNGMLSMHFTLPVWGIDLSREPIFSVTFEIIRGCVQELTRAIPDAKPDFFARFKDTFIRWGKHAGLAYDDMEGFVIDPTVERAGMGFLTDVLKSLLELTSKNQIGLLVSIDNLDKLPDEILKGFLRNAASQGLLEIFSSNRASVAIAMDPKKIESVLKTPDLSYLRGDTVHLEPLSPREAEALVELRVNKYSDGTKTPKNPLSPEVVRDICNKQKGIAREILNDAKLICQRAYELRITKIGKDDMRRLSIPRAIRVYYEVLDKNQQAALGAERLLSLVERVSEENVGDIAEGILDLRARGSPKFSPKNQELLMEEHVVTVDAKGYGLSLPVSELFSAAQERGLPPKEFLAWFLRKETVEITRVHAPAFPVERRMQYLVGKVSQLSPIAPKVKVVLEYAGERIDIESKSEVWFKEITNWLHEAISRYRAVESASWEDTSNFSLCESIHFTMKNFLLAFARFFAAIGCSSPLTIRSKLDYVDSWDTIWGAIARYQAQQGFTFTTYKYIQFVCNCYRGARRGGGIDEAEVSQMRRMFEQVVQEISGEWDKLLLQNASAFRPREDEIPQHQELHEALRSKMSSLLERMGYTEIVEEYRTFKVDPDRYRREGIFKPSTQTTDIAEVDIVRMRKEVTKDGKLRNQYAFCEVKRGNKKSDAREVLSFLFKCHDLVRLLDEKTADFSQILKPEYQFYFVSYSGFDDSALRIRSMTKIPLRSKFTQLDLNDLNQLLREHNLPVWQAASRVSKI